MRIAVSGAHAVGKSMFIAELVTSLPDYEVVEEPYYHLLNEGVVFSGTPTVDDMELQLDRSRALLERHHDSNILFDRCPADYLAYLRALRGATDTLAYWLRPAAEALASLDLIIFVPIERPDRIHVPEAENPRLRKRVDLALRQILIDDELGLSLNVLEVHGPLSDRVAQAQAHLGGAL